MPATEIEFSTPVLAYQAIRHKLLSLRRRKRTTDEEAAAGRQSKRRREFASPEVIKRLNGDDGIRKVAVVASVQAGENGIAVFLMPLHGKALQTLISLLETFHTAHATKKPVVDGALTSDPASVTPPGDQVAEVAGVGYRPTAVSESPPPQGTEVVAGSYSSDSSSTTVEAPEHDPDSSLVFGEIGFEATYRPKGRLTSVSSEMSVASNTTVILVGSLTPAPRQAGPSKMEMQVRRPPSEITVDWQDAVADEQEEKLAEGNGSLLSISPGSPKTMHVKTPGQSGMPSPNVEIYSTANTPGEAHLTKLHSADMPVEGTKPETIPEVPERHKKQDRPVVPFFYGSKIPVMSGKFSSASGKNTYGSLISHQRRISGSDLPNANANANANANPNPKPSMPKPHTCTSTPLADPKPRGLKRSLTTPVRVLTRKDTIAGHFPSTPPKPTVTTTPTSSGSTRPRSSSKIPIPSPTTPTAIIGGRKPNDIFGFGESLLSGITEADCEAEAIWERRRDDVMGPLGGSPSTRFGGFVRPAKLMRSKTLPMGSLVGTAMAENDVMRS